MAETLDLDKVKSAYDYLAETDKGKSALGEFNGALQKLQDSIEGGLNRGEFIYVLRGLVNDLNVEEASSEDIPEDTDQLRGLVFQDRATNVTRLGSGVQSAALNRVVQGFNVRIAL